ncbi:helicase associated domain-containing protein [Sunxiuqinia elliptica]|uniref:HKD family nuclease n=1 Tax=Sunxiuqinia elliptica TaxID=655355 RepID=A0A1I2EBV6_9BACT|nr:phospholipase D-like domain-containing protein [Sunxiuqinia elliptica]SFE89941.1 HKD family nuclease [Sunxiuqinia elliptica]
MITEFIGQGLTDNVEESTGDYICSSLKEEVFTDITFFVAFMRSKGLLKLKPFIQTAIAQKRNITIYVGIDDKITSKEALEMLLELDVEAYVYNSKRYIFHPKIYLFEGELRNRIIVGSSNLTKTGLFFNIESSILLDFTGEDKSGFKVLNQLKEYYSPLLEFDSDNLDKVTPEHIKFLVDNSRVSIEQYESDEDYTVNAHDNSKEKNRNPKIGELGNIEISENKKSPKRYELKITEEYLEKWDSMFERMKEFKEKYNKTTVPRDYHDRTLYGWFRKQKNIYNHPTLKMPEEHLEKLISIDFHFEDGHKERERLIELNWLRILKEALEAGENVKANHRYKFNNETIGTFLVGVKQANNENPPRKLELRKEIEELGFDYKETSRKPEHVVQRYLDKLVNDENPNKMSYQNHFNSAILPKKNKISAELKKELEEVWELQFEEPRTWEKKSKVQDYTPEWKAFRYNRTLNPEGKWYKGKSHMGDIYEWVWGKKKNKRKMDLVIDRFNEQEKRELKNEGFPID